MIRYSLKCAKGHAFDSWFQSADAFDTLAARGMVACVECGSTEVEKALMAPKVVPKGEVISRGDLQHPQTEMEAKLAAFRRKIEAEATYVGGRFATEARAIHASETPDRPIYGEANAAEVKGLLEDGIPIAPLPFLPKSKAN
ncbi:hypothetical protein JSE7799_00716 [Jannaschia seosinensis]|uniref:DUF1178 family protein n=1 Tax=Jannaschia seosinensis TaxID=313367 RepID=A0A0M7B876_9RHOB|nr:DUF1178 family protein [Jannaschia seosinensis]CUH25934.1 hypothetical protein JSE7799_00716 [Jannaschia seosinensis]